MVCDVGKLWMYWKRVRQKCAGKVDDCSTDSTDNVIVMVTVGERKMTYGTNGRYFFDHANGFERNNITVDGGRINISLAGYFSNGGRAW